VIDPEQLLRVRAPDFQPIRLGDARTIEPFASLADIFKRPIDAE
jgi:hypothetical protein